MIKKNAWRVLVPGLRPFTLVGGEMTREEALEHARGTWPDAEVE